MKSYFAALLLLSSITLTAHVHRIQNSTDSAVLVRAGLVLGPVMQTMVPARSLGRLDVGGYLTSALSIEGLDGQLKGAKKVVKVPDPKFGKDIIIGAGQNGFVVEIN